MNSQILNTILASRINKLGDTANELGSKDTFFSKDMSSTWKSLLINNRSLNTV